MNEPNMLEIAQTAIFRLSEIALALGAEKGLQLCCSLGAELFIVWYSLNAPTSEDEGKMQGLISKLLRDIERVCSVIVSVAPLKGNLRRAVSFGKLKRCSTIRAPTISTIFYSCKTIRTSITIIQGDSDCDFRLQQEHLACTGTPA
jgi:hypothetical protein